MNFYYVCNISWNIFEIQGKYSSYVEIFFQFFFRDFFFRDFFHIILNNSYFQPFMLTVMLQPTVLFLAVTWRLTKQSNIGRKCRFPAEHPDFNPLAHSVLSPLSDHPDTSNSFFKPCRISHSVWKSQKKSHSTLPAKRATFTFWVDKSLFKNAKNGPFWWVFVNLKLVVKQCYQIGYF